jgi:DNA repair protein RecN (Recombination protein N)
MLRQLAIRDYLLVRHVQLDFSQGLTALTGETGAGKSMVIGALDVLLGERFPKDAVANGADKAVIEGIFDLKHPEKIAGILPPEDEPEIPGEFLLRREISRQGRTRAFLNDRPLPMEALQAIRDQVADFHGQRESQTLFKSAAQLEYLDIFADALSLAGQVAALHGQRNAARRDLEQAQSELTTHRKDRALLEYQLEEIQRLGLTTGEEETVEARLLKLESAEKLSAEASHLLDLLAEGNPSLVSLSGLAKTVASGITKTDPDLQVISGELAEISARLKDLAGEVHHYSDGLSFDDAELARLRERRSVIWDLRRKHGMTLDQILARADELKTLLEQGEVLEQKCSDLEKILQKAESALLKSAQELSQKRHAVAADFSARIASELKILGFPDPRFEVSLQSIEPVETDRITAQGIDRVDLLFSANPGSKLAPIGAVASGGESSRVTLAIKSVLSEKAEYPMMVYDEIDLGISGRVADQVGMALSALARRHQVLVITHLPQIASRADHHLAITKVSHGNKTETSARFLTDNERIQAVAALIAGSNITDQSLASASELLRQSGKLKSISK